MAPIAPTGRPTRSTRWRWWHHRPNRVPHLGSLLSSSHSCLPCSPHGTAVGDLSLLTRALRLRYHAGATALKLLMSGNGRRAKHLKVGLLRHWMVLGLRFDPASLMLHRMESYCDDWGKWKLAYIYIYIYTHLHTYMCIYVYRYIYIYTHILYIYIHVCVYIYTYIIIFIMKYLIIYI